MWFITTTWNLSYAKLITISSCLLKLNMLFYIYEPNTLFILWVCVFIYVTTKVTLYITSEHFTRVYYITKQTFGKTIIVYDKHFYMLKTLYQIVLHTLCFLSNAVRIVFQTKVFLYLKLLLSNKLLSNHFKNWHQVIISYLLNFSKVLQNFFYIFILANACLYMYHYISNVWRT